MPPKVLVVFGATGNQGRALLERLVQENSRHGWTIKGITRDVTSQAAQFLRSIGIDMIAANLDDVNSLHHALAGATHVFANTDSNQIIAHASQNPHVLSTGQTPTTYAKEVELRYGDNLRKALIENKSLERIVWSSLPSPKKWSGGRYSKVTMFDAKEEIADMLRNEPSLRDKLSVLMIGFYADNALNVPELYAPQKELDGSYSLSLPMPGDVLVPFADVKADVSKWVNALFEAPPGLTLIGASDWHTWSQWTEVWAETNGVQAVYCQVPAVAYATRKKGIGEAVAEEFEFVGKYGFAGGNQQAVTPEELKRYGLDVEGTKYDSYIRSCDWSKIL